MSATEERMRKREWGLKERKRREGNVTVSFTLFSACFRAENRPPTSAKAPKLPTPQLTTRVAGEGKQSTSYTVILQHATLIRTCFPVRCSACSSYGPQFPPAKGSIRSNRGSGPAPSKSAHRSERRETGSLSTLYGIASCAGPKRISGSRLCRRSYTDIVPLCVAGYAGLSCTSMRTPYRSLCKCCLGTRR